MWIKQSTVNNQGRFFANQDNLSWLQMLLQVRLPEPMVEPVTRQVYVLTQACPHNVLGCRFVSKLQFLVNPQPLLTLLFHEGSRKVPSESRICHHECMLYHALCILRLLSVSMRKVFNLEARTCTAMGWSSLLLKITWGIAPLPNCSLFSYWLTKGEVRGGHGTALH